jgi:hypothetical protein
VRASYFQNASVSNQVVEVFGAMFFESIVEAVDDAEGRPAVGFHLLT